MQRREFLIGTAATAVATIAQIPLPALAKRVEPEDHIVRYSDVLFESMRRNRRTPYDKDSRALVIRAIMNRHWLEAKEQGKILHLYVDTGQFWPKEWSRFTPAHFISDKISLIQPDGTYRLVKDRTKVIEYAKA